MRAGVIRPYKPAKHRHTGEIEQELSEIAGKKIKVSMSPHAVDIVRGILCTNHAFLQTDMMRWTCGRYIVNNIKMKNSLD